MKSTALFLALVVVALNAFAGTEGRLAVRKIHSSTNISTSAYTQIFGTISGNANELDVYNSSTSGTLTVATGCTGGSQKDVLTVAPGTNKTIPFQLAQGGCLSIKATQATVSAGDSSWAILGDAAP